MKNTVAPVLLNSAIIGDDPVRVAKLISRLARKGKFLPVLDGPRLTRPDADDEIRRRRSAVSMIGPRRVYFTGLSESTASTLMQPLDGVSYVMVRSDQDMAEIEEGRNPIATATLQWGPKRKGVGLLNALRTGRLVEFDLEESPNVASTSFRARNLVVCEEGNDFAQIVAANYAFAIGADIVVIPQLKESKAETILESLYSLYERSEQSPTTKFEEIASRIRELAGLDHIPAGGCITFITWALPWGIAYPEIPTTHLFINPDLATAIVNAVTTENMQKGARVALLIDPGTVDAKEVSYIAPRLAKRGVFVRGIRGDMAEVTRVSAAIEVFPYDLLLISTHCGDVSGWRWTYNFLDNEGIQRELVLDIAIGVGQSREIDKLEVTEYIRFISLDGVDWKDGPGKTAHYIGTAILDFMERFKDYENFKPSKREEIPRVFGSAALKMYDHNYIPVPSPLAGGGCPIVINNACGSWHRLAGTFTFGNARAYVGTLFDVLDVEAVAVMEELLDREFSNSLAVSLWHAQRRVWSSSVRRPYAMVGCHFQKIVATSEDVPKYLSLRLLALERAHMRALDSLGSHESEGRGKIENALEVLRFEIAGIQRYIAGLTN